MRRGCREGFSQALVHSRPVPGGRWTGIVSRSREHLPPDSSRMSGPKGTAVSAHLETVLGWDAPGVWSPSCPPECALWGIHRHGWESEAGPIPVAPPGPSHCMCTPHSVPWAPISGPRLAGHCSKGPPGPRAEASPQQEGTGGGTSLEKIRGGVAAIFKPTKGKRNASCDPEGGEGRTYQRPRRHLLTRLPW